MLAANFYLVNNFLYQCDSHFTFKKYADSFLIPLKKQGTNIY